MEKIEFTFTFDEIGRWSEIKLEIIEKYGAAYTKAFSNTSLKKYYIDGFSGAGIHISKETKQEVKGSPTRALEIIPPFDAYYFIDLNKNKSDNLKKCCQNRNNVHVYTGDCNEELIKNILPNIHYDKYNRALCILDPYGLHLDWKVIEMLGKSKAVDMFLNFPIMDMNRNAIWKNPYDRRIRDEDLKRMNTFWGDETWKDIAYTEERDLFGTVPVKQDNDIIVDAFIDRLKKVAGFSYVAKPLAMKNSNNAIVYYLLFASQKPVADKIIKDIYKKYQE